MKVQRIQVEGKGYPLYLLLNKEYEVVKPIRDFITYLDNTGKSPNTIKTYCYHLKLLYEYMEQKGLTLEEVKFEHLSDFIGWLRNPYGQANVISMVHQEAKRAESTVNAILNAVTSFMDYLSRTEGFSTIAMFKEVRGRRFKGFLHHINKGKTYRTSVLKLRVVKKKLKLLSPEEVRTILEACSSYRDKLILMLMYEGGLRIGEVLSLRVEDLVSWDNVIMIQPRQDSLNNAYAKSRRERTVHVGKELMGIYTNYLVYEYPEDLEHDYVFVNRNHFHSGRPLKYQSVLDLIRRLRKKTGISFTPHILRHTHATELVRQGWDVTYVQKRLGHANVQTTLNTYIHLSDQDMKNAYQKYLDRRGDE